MTQLNAAFDSGQHDNMNSGFEPFPKGKYIAIVKESDILPNSKKTGEYIKLKFEIMKGEYKGRFVWTNLNIKNPNPVAVEIAQKELATLCRAVGKPVIQDTQQLHGVPFILHVKIKPAKGDYPAGNEPSNYEPLSKKGAPSFANNPKKKQPPREPNARPNKQELAETDKLNNETYDGDAPWGDVPDEDDGYVDDEKDFSGLGDDAGTDTDDFDDLNFDDDLPFN